MVFDAIAKEDWYESMKSFVANNDEIAETRKARPFVTFISNEAKQELIQLTFDKSEFSRQFAADVSLSGYVHCSYFRQFQ